MSRKLTTERTRGVLSMLFSVRRNIREHNELQAMATIEMAIMKMAGVYHFRRCQECGKIIPIERYQHGGPRVLYCSRLHENRVSKRRQYAAMKTDPARYTAYLMQKRPRDAARRQRCRQEHRCSTCGGPNDNDNHRVCERCLMKARKVSS